MKNIYILIILIYLLIFSCSRSESLIYEVKEDIAVLKINISNITDKTVLEIFRNYKLLKLNNPDSLFMGKIDKIINYDETIYVLDKEFAGLINSYDYEGNLKNSFSFWDLPYENTTSISDFDVQKINDSIRVFVLDSPNRNMLVLNEGLELIQVIKYPNSSFKFKVTEGYTYQFRNEFAHSYEDSALFYNYIISDLNGEIKNHYEKFTIPIGRKVRFTPREPLTKYDKEVLLTKWGNDTIYNFHFDGITPKYYIDFGDYSLSNYPEVGALELVEFAENNPKKVATGITNFVESDEYICFQFFYDRDLKFALYEKSTGELTIANSIGNKPGEILPPPYTYYNGTFISFIDETLLSIKEFKVDGIDLNDEIVNKGSIYVLIFEN